MNTMKVGIMTVRPELYPSIMTHQVVMLYKDGVYTVEALFTTEEDAKLFAKVLKLKTKNKMVKILVWEK